MLRNSLLSLAVLSALLFAGAQRTVLAQDLPGAAGAIGTVGNDLKFNGNPSGSIGGDDIGSIVLYSMRSVRKLVNIVAILIIVITGFLQVTAQDDQNQLSKARYTLIAAAAALVLINVAEPMYNALNQGFIGKDTGGALNGAQGASIITSEILGFIDFIEEPLLAVAVLMIIISGIRAILEFGSEQGVTQIRRTIISILSGIVLIASKFALASATAGQVGEVNPNDINSSGITETVVHIATILVGFMALAAVTVIVIAGIMMIFNKGDQETATKARALILRVVLGLLVILISFGIVLIFAQIAP
ncbi:hypothetical protein COU76_01385 [Candidatus Peregrinibacteria bacterium CG10_big_fil_rev_8_21_14_0_10_49_10]|nr:MAG: hypothetical protein COU76_01385 [Candidatus Peregrinibacteria bacterium CG10_big_fil_rev_8_21_14_0_10_49_10]